MLIVRRFAVVLVFISPKLWAFESPKNFGPALSISPDGSEILLEGTDTNNVEHVLHSTPSVGIALGLSFRGLVGNWAPRFEFSTHRIRFSGANGESIEYGSTYYNSYAVGIENQILSNWVASALIGYSDKLFPWSPSLNTIEIDKIHTPTVSFNTSAGVYQYESYIFGVSAKIFGYLPVSTPNYSAKLGYGVQPAISTTHVFSNHISGKAEAFYQKRIQDSSVFNLTEQDFGISLTLLFE